MREGKQNDENQASSMGFGQHPQAMLGNRNLSKVSFRKQNKCIKSRNVEKKKEKSRGERKEDKNGTNWEDRQQQQSKLVNPSISQREKKKFDEKFGKAAGKLFDKENSEEEKLDKTMVRFENFVEGKEGNKREGRSVRKDSCPVATEDSANNESTTTNRFPLLREYGNRFR